MCRCRLISASIHGKCHLAKEHTHKSKCCVHIHRACCWQAALGKSPLLSTLPGGLLKGLCKVFIVQQYWVSSGTGRACLWPTEGLWLMGSPLLGCCESWQRGSGTESGEAETGVNAPSSTFLTLLLLVPTSSRLHNLFLTPAPCLVA